MGIQNSIQDHPRHVPVSLSLWQGFPFNSGNRIQGVVGHTEIELGYELSWLKRMLDIDELEELRNDAYFNSKIAKDRQKKWHDQLITQKTFNQGDQVLLYDPKLHLFLSKLKSRWTSPFIIHQAYLNGSVDLLNLKGKKIFKVNGQRVKPYAGRHSAEDEEISLLDPPLRPNCSSKFWFSFWSIFSLFYF